LKDVVILYVGLKMNLMSGEKNVRNSGISVPYSHDFARF